MGVQSLKVKFNGMFHETESGCAPCGQRRKSTKSFMTSRHLILPSGITKTFVQGEPMEVTAMDADWLLSWKEKDPSGLEREVFSKVE